MKVILVGHPGSQHIVPASKYLVTKYLPGFEQVWLNYDGPTKGWSNFVADYLESIEDKKVILTLDDYLVNGNYNTEEMMNAFGMPNLCVKLCPNTPQELAEYPITTQYCLWDKEFLIKILRRTTDPWDFEINGSAIFKKEYFGAVEVCPCIPYDVHSCLSRRWTGINFNGLKEEDVNQIKQLII